MPWKFSSSQLPRPGVPSFQGEDNAAILLERGVDAALVEDLKARYRAGTVGDVEVKRKLATAINELLAPIRARREAAEVFGRERSIGRDDDLRVGRDVREVLRVQQPVTRRARILPRSEMNLRSRFVSL